MCSHNFCSHKLQSYTTFHINNMEKRRQVENLLRSRANLAEKIVFLLDRLKVLRRSCWYDDKDMWKEINHEIYQQGKEFI